MRTQPRARAGGRCRWCLQVVSVRCRAWTGWLPETSRWVIGRYPPPCFYFQPLGRFSRQERNRQEAMRKMLRATQAKNPRLKLGVSVWMVVTHGNGLAESSSFPRIILFVNTDIRLRRLLLKTPEIKSCCLIKTCCLIKEAAARGGGGDCGQETFHRSPWLAWTLSENSLTAQVPHLWS